MLLSRKILLKKWKVGDAGYWKDEGVGGVVAWKGGTVGGVGGCGKNDCRQSIVGGDGCGGVCCEKNDDGEGGDGGGERLLLLLLLSLLNSCLSFNLFNLFLIIKSAPGGPRALFISSLAIYFLPTSCSFSKELTIGFLASNVEILQKQGQADFVFLKYFCLLDQAFA